MLKTISVRALRLINMLSRRLRLLFQRRDVFLVDDKAFWQMLASIGFSQEQQARPIHCASCGRELTTESVQAWIVFSEGIVFYCDAEDCLATLAERKKAYGT